MAYNPPTYGETGEVYTDNVRNSLEAVRTTADEAKQKANSNDASLAATSQTADEAKEIAEAAKAFVEAPTDGRVAALVDDPASSTTAALNAAFASKSAQGFEPARNVTISALAGTPLPFDADDAYLYGFTGEVLYRTTDALNGPWEAVRDFATVTGGAGAGDFTALLATGDGEVLAVRLFGIFKSSGWATDPLTATWAKVLSPAGTGDWFFPFGVDSDPTTGYAVATTYASPSYSDSRYVWVTTDGGATWAQAFDLNTEYPDVAATSHMHVAHIDQYHVTAGIPRIWITAHDTQASPTFSTMRYSDDGGTSWTELDTPWHPTAGVAVEDGMLFGSDDNTNGLFRVPRDTMRLEVAHEIMRAPVWGWGMRGAVDADGNAHMVFLSDTAGVSTVIVSSDGYRANETYELVPESTTDKPRFQNVMVHGGKIVATFDRTSGIDYVLVADVPRVGTVPPGNLNRGGIFGGQALNGSAVAVGAGAEATQLSTVAIGYRARATASSESVAIGTQAVSGSQSVAVGRSADASAVLSTAVGWGAKPPASGVAVGRNANGTGTGSTIVGYQATSGTYGNATAIGAAANVAGSDSTALGHSASTNNSRAVALGRSASAGHADSVALGANTATTAANQVMVGDRDIESSRIGGGVVLVSPDGTRYKVTVANGGTLTVTAV